MENITELEAQITAHKKSLMAASAVGSTCHSKAALERLHTVVLTLCAASIMPVSQWMYYRKLRSAFMRLTVRSLFKAVSQYVFS